MKHAAWMMFATVLAAAPCAHGAQTLISERTLSLDAAQEVARGALEACRKEGHKVTVTVLDQAGRTVVMLRDDGARPHSVEHSLRKAYTALTYNTPSGDYGKRATENAAGVGPLHLANITTAGGGLPIRAGKSTVGAVGVSGSPSSQGISGGVFDEKCSQAGIDRIAAGLRD
jgi:uncharacterized protein GlcG (DUF336 family)